MKTTIEHPVIPSCKGLTRILYAARYSVLGLKHAWKQEAAFRQEIILCAVLMPVVLMANVSDLERAMLFATAVLVIIVELLNSALEAVVDRTGLEFHPLSGSAKDMGSAAVLVSLLLMTGVWICILL